MEHVIEKKPQLLGEKDPTDPLLAKSPLSSWARRGKLAWRVARFQMRCNFTPETTSTNRLLSTSSFFRSHHGAEFGGLSLLRQFARWSCRSPCWVWSLENCAAKSSRDVEPNLLATWPTPHIISEFRNTPTRLTRIDALQSLHGRTRQHERGTTGSSTANCEVLEPSIRRIYCLAVRAENLF
jgi:hypothetical protein